MQKAAVSVVEMARLVGLSRRRFYQLVGKTFPFPIYDVATRRPFYPPDLQQVCLEVRQRNCGIDGKPVMFYARRQEIAPSKPGRARNSQYADLMDGLKALGLVNVTTAQVNEAMKVLYPSGVKDMNESEVLRAVFLHLKRRDSRDNLA